MDSGTHKFTLIIIIGSVIFLSFATCQENTDINNPEIKIIENYDTLKNFAEILSLKEFINKVIYIDIWVAPCSPCIAEFKYLPELKNKYKDENLVFLYLARSYGLFRMSKWESEMQKYNLEGYHIYMTEKLKDIIYDEVSGLRGTGLPKFILIDKKGSVAYPVAPRPSSGEELYSLIDQLLNEK